MVDVEQRQVVANEVEHGSDCCSSEHRKPLSFRLSNIIVTIFACENGADGCQIITWVHSLRDFANLFAERLAIPEVDRPSERVDLLSRVVDVIFFGDPEARGFK